MDTLDTFLCCDCDTEWPVRRNGGTGYAREPGTWRFICYECCGKRDRASMLTADRVAMYLHFPFGMRWHNGGTLFNIREPDGDKIKLTNWPGTFEIPIYCVTRGRHNIAGTRYDVWFSFGGASWHGVTYGDNTQLCHCKRVKGR